jgi:hypothetical protein
MALMQSMTIEMQKPPTWELHPTLDAGGLEIPLGTAYLAMHFGGVAWDEVVTIAQQHPLLLPRDEQFGPEDLHRVPEATTDAEP